MTSLALLSSVLILISAQVASEKIIKIYKIECAYNDKYISNMSCFLKVPERGVVQSNGFLVLKKVVKDAFIHSELVKFDDRYKPYMRNITFHICDFFKSKGIQNALVSNVVKSFEKNSNLVRCGHDVRNFFL